jgi:hypothetical protein
MTSRIGSLHTTRQNAARAQLWLLSSDAPRTNVFGAITVTSGLLR